MDRQDYGAAANAAVFDQPLLGLRCVHLERESLAAMRADDVDFVNQFHSKSSCTSEKSASFPMLAVDQGAPRPSSITILDSQESYRASAILMEISRSFFSEVRPWPHWSLFSFAAGGGKEAVVDQKTSSAYTATRNRPLRILLVDDHRDTLRSLQGLLRRLGHDVLPAENMTEALRIAEDEPFDFLLSDIGLPDGSGLELLRRIRKTRRIQAVAVSGFGMEEDVERSREAGFLDHLTKPVSLERLQEAILQAGSQSS